MPANRSNLQLSALLLLACAAGLCQANVIGTCYSCYGIDCQRTSLKQESKCVDSLDYCVTIYDESKVLYKGCSLEIPVELRQRCESHETGSCFKCNTDRCNNVGAAEFACLQCDSSQDANCAQRTEVLEPSLCVAPTAPNSYCYATSSGGKVQRGCATTMAEQQSCLADANCFLCSPSDVEKCNGLNIATGSGNRFIRFLK